MCSASQRHPSLAGPLGLIGVQVNRGRGHGRTSQIVSDGCQFGTSSQRMSAMRMPHPMGTSPAQFFCRFRGLCLYGVGGCQEESFGDIPQPARRNSALTVSGRQIGNEQG